MKTTTQRLLVGLLMTTLFAACSRPVAHFQPSQREYFKAPSAAPVAAVDANVVPQASLPTDAPSMKQLAQTNPVMDQLEAYVRNDSKLAADKKVEKRLNRVRTLLAVSSSANSVSPTATTAPRKANLMERLVLKKMNKKINKQLAPQNPNKPMVNTGILATGAVLVIVGLLLVLLTSGTASTLGIIVLLAGAVLLLVGLL